MRKRTTAMFGLALTLATIWQRADSSAVKAFESSSIVVTGEQSSPLDPRFPTWEYKVLTGTITWPVRVTSTDGRFRTVPLGPNVEDEINRFAAQGYVVESFQTSWSAGGGSGVSFSHDGPPVIIVLMKRMRK